MKCDRKLAAFGDSMPDVNSTIVCDGSTAIWQSIQFVLITDAVRDFISGIALCSPVWHVWHLEENNAVFPRSFACASWQVLHVISLFKKHLLALIKPN